MDVRRVSRDIRFRVGVVLGIVVLLLIGAAGMWWGSDAGTAKEDADASSSQAPPSQPNPAGGELRVVETGVSATVDAFDEPMASYGIVLENTSQQVAHSTTVQVTMSDNGKAVKDLNRDSVTTDRSVYAVLPGEKAVVTASTFVDHEEVSDVEVELGEPDWLPLDNTDPPFAELTADSVEVEVDNHLVKFTFAVRSDYESALDNPSAQALLRDGDGNIVGGTNATDSRTDVYPPGDSEDRIESRGGLPEKFDTSAVEVYPSPVPG